MTCKIVPITFSLKLSGIQIEKRNFSGEFASASSKVGKRPRNTLYNSIEFRAKDPKSARVCSMFSSGICTIAAAYTRCPSIRARGIYASKPTSLPEIVINAI
jgi:hypothetical protein